MKILIGYIFTYGYLISVLFFTSILKKKIKLQEETSRKLVHILVGFSWFIMVYFFDTTYHLVIPPLTFIVINYISYKKNLITSIERTDKESLGTVYYAFSFAFLSFATVLKNDFLPFYGIGVLTMAIGDGLAPFVGRKFNKYKIFNSTKTYFGSLVILVSAVVISLFIMYLYSLDFSFLYFVIIGVSSIILEFIGFKGTDNLTLPIGIALISYLIV